MAKCKHTWNRIASDKNMKNTGNPLYLAMKKQMSLLSSAKDEGSNDTKDLYLYLYEFTCEIAVTMIMAKWS